MAEWPDFPLRRVLDRGRWIGVSPPCDYGRLDCGHQVCIPFDYSTEDGTAPCCECADERDGASETQTRTSELFSEWTGA